MFIIAIGAVLGGAAALFAINKIGAIGVADAFDRTDVEIGDLTLAMNAGMIVGASTFLPSWQRSLRPVGLAKHRFHRSIFISIWLIT